MVQHEIECKAHLSKEDFFRLQNTLEHFCTKKESVHKQDIYYIFSDNVHVRLRKNNNMINVLSMKKKCIEDGIEKNIEHETQVQDSEVIDTIFTQLTPQKCIKKVKIGFSYLLEKEGLPIIVELIEVKKLGYFIEVEYNEALAAQNSIKNKVNTVKSVLLNLLTELQITKEAIEPRYYIDMLQNI